MLDTTQVQQEIQQEMPQRSLLHLLQLPLQLPPEVRMPTYEDILREESVESDTWGNLEASLIN